MNTADRPRLTLCMIVRDNERTIEASLASARPWVDEIIIVDTGSTDRTLEIAARFGAKIYHFPWCDDFSAARNESLRHATGEWIFWMDSDDTIDEVNGRKLRELAYAAHDPRVVAYTIQVECLGGTESGVREATRVDHVKLFRNLPEIRFEFRIHEQLLPSIRRLGGEVAWTDIFVVHSGSDPSPAARKKKYERDLRILKLELAERPNHPFGLFNMGMTRSDMGDHEEAAKYLELCLKYSQPEETQVRKAYALLAHSYDQLGHSRKALECCQQGLAFYPDDPELLFRQGKIAHDLKTYALAVTSYRQVLTNCCERHFTSIDFGIMGFKAHHNLALVYQDMGRPDLAELEFRATLEFEPNFRIAWRILGQQLIQQRRFTSVQVFMESASTNAELACDVLLVDADLSIAKSDAATARQRLIAARDRFPQRIEPLLALCKFEFEHGTPEDAVTHLRALAEREPNDAATLHNLGTMQLRIGQLQDAALSFERSLEIRPDSPPTTELLRLTRQAIGRQSSAPVAVPRVANQPNESMQRPPFRQATPRKHPLNVCLVTVSYNLVGGTRTVIDSAMRDCDHDLSFLIYSHSRISAKQQELDELACRRDVTLFDYGTNRGLAKSWNEGIMNGFERGSDVILVVNEDVQFSDGDVQFLADAAFQQPDKFLVMGRCHHEHEKSWEWSEYGCFAVNRLAWETLGCLDENFFPVFCEDSDYRRRAKLLGFEPGYCPDTAIRHAGSKSLASPQVARQNEITYAGNRDYYRRKWGGDASAELFDRPFDDSRFSHYIDPRVREAPYPGYNRTDQHIVAL